MLARRNPRDLYRSVDFDARVTGADPRALVGICFEQVNVSLGAALRAFENGDNALKSRSVTRAVAAITALQLGVDPAAPIAPVLLQFYEAARTSLLDCVPNFDRHKIAEIRKDFSEISSAFGDVFPISGPVREQTYFTV